MTDKIVEIGSKQLSVKDVKAAAEAEVKKEQLEKFKEDYISLLKQKEAALLVVRNIERQIEELEEKIGE